MHVAENLKYILGRNGLIQNLPCKPAKPWPWLGSEISSVTESSDALELPIIELIIDLVK